MAAVTICSDFGAPPKIKSDTVSTVSPSIFHKVMGPDAMILPLTCLKNKETTGGKHCILCMTGRYCCSQRQMIAFQSISQRHEEPLLISPPQPSPAPDSSHLFPAGLVMGKGSVRISGGPQFAHSSGGGWGWGGVVWLKRQ